MVGKSATLRAAKACERCRARKVRCDVVYKPDQCTNCMLDEVACVDLPRRRRKRSQVDRQERAMRRAIPTDIMPTETMQPSPGQGDCIVISEVGLTQLRDKGPRDESPPPPGFASNDDLFPDFKTALLMAGNASSAPHNESREFSSETMLEPSEELPSQDCERFLPSFVAPLTSQRSRRYHEILHTKGAFHVPQLKLRNEILLSYVHFVHPQLPLVDLHDFLQAVASEGKDGRTSILLFQAVMLAGASFVNAEYICAAGYQSRIALRQELAERVRLLYDFDCENDRLIQIQSLVLMTYWQEKPDEVKHLRHWMSIAYDIALLIGLNKDPCASSMPVRQKRLWRRVWWSLYIRDRTLALGIRQLPIIAAKHCETPELELEDFDIQPTTSALSSLFESHTLLQDLDQQRRLAEVCVAQLQLSHHICDVLKARYMTVAPKLGCTRLIALVLVPKGPKTDTAEVQKCAHSLEEWFRGIPDHLRYRSPPSLYFSPGQDLLNLHCAVLNLFYYALVCALLRPYPSPIFRTLPASESCAQRKARHAASAILSILGDLQVQEMLCFMPSPGVTFLLQAAVTHLCDSKSNTTNLRSQSRQQVEACLEFLNTLKEVHAHASFAKSFLASAAAKLYGQSRSIDETSAGGTAASISPAPELNDSSAGHSSPPTLSRTARVASDDWASLAGADPDTEIPLGDNAERQTYENGSLNAFDRHQWADLNAEYESLDFGTGLEFFLDLNSFNTV